MRRSLFVVFALAIAVPTIADAPSKAPIEESINQLVAQFSDGIAVSYDKYRRIEFGKIFGSDRQDAVALFTVEAFAYKGNYHAEYLAVFEAVAPTDEYGRRTKPYRLVAVTQIGGRGQRSFDGPMKLGKGAVTLTGKKYGPNDAMCCPSVPINVTFRIKNGMMTEEKS